MFITTGIKRFHFTRRLQANIFTEAHSKVKTGADFPTYIQEVKKLGLVTYEFHVSIGQTIYCGENRFTIESLAKYEPVEISPISSKVAVQHSLSIHQQGKTNFPTFVSQVAAAGVQKWVVDTKRMVCTYYSVNGEEIVLEPIPESY